ncbi:MAG: TRL-like protein family [Desulfobacteraceae bacterium]|nr:TRL-like protein family [Desulfobacteraceae bacterium]
MKKIIMFSALGLFLFVMGCATPYPVGSFYTGLKLPVAVTANKGIAPKVGTAECTSILSIIATGDASIETAKKNGGITKVHHVDWDVENILGIIGRYKVTVYGE